MEQITRYEIGSVTNNETNQTFPLLILPDTFERQPDTLAVSLEDGHLNIVDRVSRAPLLQYAHLPTSAVDAGAVLLGFPYIKKGVAMELYTWISE